MVTTTANTAPTITLLTTTAAPATTSIKLGYNYTACAADQQPSTGAECELGATAQDAQNGNLTASVLVCAPAVCTAASCVTSKAVAPSSAVFHRQAQQAVIDSHIPVMLSCTLPGTICLMSVGQCTMTHAPLASCMSTSVTVVTHSAHTKAAASLSCCS